MPTRIVISVGGVRVQADLADTPCAQAIAEKLPLTAPLNEWGDEFYCAVGLGAPADETATSALVPGDMGYWPPGDALCIFFGPTPMSTGADPVPASDVNRVGTIRGDARVLARVKGAREIDIARAD